jgi:hypothetical protein
MVLLVSSGLACVDHYAIPAIRLPGWRVTGSTGGRVLRRGEIVTSLASAGLSVEFVHEFDFELFRRFDSLRRQEDGTYRLPAGQPRVPMMYSLRASLPGRRYATDDSRS